MRRTWVSGGAVLVRRVFACALGYSGREFFGEHGLPHFVVGLNDCVPVYGRATVDDRLLATSPSPKCAPHRVDPMHARRDSTNYAKLVQS